LSREIGSDLVLVKNLEKVVMWRSIFKVPVNGTELGLRGQA